MKAAPADLTVWLPWARGAIAVTENDPRAALDDFTAAASHARTIPGFDEHARLRLEELLSFAYIRLGDGTHAEPLLREIIKAYTERDGVDNPNTLRAGIRLVQMLLVARRYSEAVKEADVIYPALVSRMGADHETTLTLLGARAAAEGSLGQWDAAIRDDLTASSLAAKKQGDSFFSLALLSDAAMSQCRAGWRAEGEANARTAHERARNSFGPENGLTEATAIGPAECLIALDRVAEAATLLDTVNAETVSGSPETRVWAPSSPC